MMTSIFDSLRTNIRWVVILLIAVTFLVYAPSLDNDFVWDDTMAIVKNDFVKSWDNFPMLFTREYLTAPSDVEYLGKRPIGAGETTYRAVVTFSYFLDYSLWKLNPAGFHMTNIIVHIINVILMYWLVQNIVKSNVASLFAALVFALHPIQSEAVCNISFREDLLAFLFFASSLLLYIRLDYAAVRKRTYLYFASLGLFFLGLFSKEMAITLPAILFLYDYYFVFNGRKGEFLSRLKSRYSGYILVALFYLWVWLFPMSREAGAVVGYPGASLYLNALTMSKVCATYIYWMLVPLGIHATIPDKSILEVSFLSFNVVASAVVLVLCIACAIKIRRSSRILSFGIAWFFITLLPALNIIPIKNIIACRYLYIPIAGFCFVMGFVSKLLVSRYEFSKMTYLRIALYGAAIVLLVCYGFLTLLQGRTWKNELTFRKEMVRHYPNSVWAHRMLAATFSQYGYYDEAILEHQIAKSLDPEGLDNYYNLGRLYRFKGMLDEAIVEFRGIIERDPHQIEAYSIYCGTLVDRKRYAEALDCFESMIADNPDCEIAYYDLGILHMRLGNIKEARQMWEKVLIINPDFKRAESQLRRLSAK